MASKHSKSWCSSSSDACFFIYNNSHHLLSPVCNSCSKPISNNNQACTPKQYVCNFNHIILIYIHLSFTPLKTLHLLIYSSFLFSSLLASGLQSPIIIPLIPPLSFNAILLNPTNVTTPSTALKIRAGPINALLIFGT